MNPIAYIKEEPTTLADYELEVNLYGINMIRLFLFVCVAGFIFISDVDFLREFFRTLFSFPM